MSNQVERDQRTHQIHLLKDILAVLERMDERLARIEEKSA
jgi:hypothetical protein